MVKILSLTALALPIIRAQNATQPSAANAVASVKAIAYASQTVASEAWINSNEPAYVKLQQRWVARAEEKFEELGFLPTSVISGLEKIVTGAGGNRVNDLYCVDGNCEAPRNLDSIWGYGCWCNFGQNLMVGHGPPVNGYDEICKSFQRCLKCARFDGKNENFECDPVIQTYSLGTGKDFNSKCSEGNSGDRCATYVCMCEETIINDLLDKLFDYTTPNDYSPDYLHDNGWDSAANCPQSPLPVINGNDCCGNYPRRYPYSLDSPVKACCQDVNIYNPLHQECCADGSSADIGACL